MQGYFSFLPQIAYDIQGNGSRQTVRNIIHRLKLRDVVSQNAAVFYQWVVRDGETPEIIAAKYYGDPQFHILVLLANDVIDPLYDWVMSYENFNAWMIKQYGDIPTAQQTIHHYEDGAGNWIDLTDYNSRPANDRKQVSAYDYWSAYNESLRTINLIDKQYAPRIMQQIQQLLNVQE